MAGTFSIMDGPKIACTYTCSWNDDFEADASQLSKEYFRAFVKKVTSGKGNPEPLLAQLFAPTGSGFDDDATESAQLFTELLQLPHYDWLSGETLASDIGEDNDPEAIEQCGFPVVATV
ncbi:MAG: hypothetical protein ACAI35_15930 [Candidatus Methylacidiphilales bacterium]